MNEFNFGETYFFAHHRLIGMDYLIQRTPRSDSVLSVQGSSVPLLLK